MIGEMGPAILKGFVTAVRALGYPVTDGEGFLRKQQEHVFAWGQAAKAA